MKPFPSALVAATAFLSVPAALRADEVTIEYANEDHFEYRLSHMPDLDQYRTQLGSQIDGLPQAGLKYAIPTCGIDIKAYIANHGFPEMNPGPALWQLPAKYAHATLEIDLLGLSQGAATNPDGPNQHLSWTIAMNNFESPPLKDKFTLTEYWGDEHETPLFEDFSKQALLGALVAVEFGRYTKIGDSFGYPVLERDGGHTIVLTRALADSGERWLYARDPAAPDDGLTLTQSAFAQHVYSVSDISFMTWPPQNGVRNGSALDSAPGAFEVALIDHVAAIRPKTGYAFKPQAFKVSKFVAYPLQGSVLPPQADYAVPIGGSLRDAKMDFLGTGAYVLAEEILGGGAPQVRLSHVGALDQVVKPLAVLPGAESLAVGRRHSVFALGGNALSRVDPGSAVPLAAVELLPAKGSDLAYDDAADQVLALSVEAARVYRFGEDLKLLETVALPAIPLQGEGALAVDPVDGALWIASEGAANVYRIPQGGSPAWTELATPNGSVPTDVDVDDRGNVYVVAGGHLFEFVRKPEGYAHDPQSKWSELEVDRRFEISRSRNDGNPALLTGPKFRPLAASELKHLVGDLSIPDCDAAAAAVAYGTGKPGTNGLPLLVAGEPPILGLPTSLRLENALPGALPLLVIGTAPLAAPFAGGTLLVAPGLVLALPIPVQADGTLTLGTTLPADPALCGAALFHQALFPDPGAAGSQHVAMTNGLLLTLGS